MSQTHSRSIPSHQRLNVISDLLPVPVVEAAEPDAFNLLVALTTRVAVAVISKDEASGAAGGDGEAADAALQDTQTDL